MSYSLHFYLFLSNLIARSMGESCDENCAIVIHYRLTDKSLNLEFATVDQMKPCKNLKISLETRPIVIY